MKLQPPRPPRIPFTQEGYNKVLEEKAKLLSQRPEAVDHLKKARDMGDLSENGYYKVSRQKLTSLDARLRHLDRLIRQAVIVSATGSGKVEIGSHVVISNEGKKMEFTIVGGYESNPAQKTISYLSPIGRSLMGKRKQDKIEVITPKGVSHYFIEEVR